MVENGIITGVDTIDELLLRLGLGFYLVPFFGPRFMLMLTTSWLFLIVLIVLVIILWVPIVPVVCRLLLFVHCDLHCAVNGLFTASNRSLHCVKTVSSLRQYGLLTASIRSLHCVITVSSLRQYGLFTASKWSLHCVNMVSLLC
jgi:hypothetical protein